MSVTKSLYQLTGSVRSATFVVWLSLVFNFSLFAQYTNVSESLNVDQITEGSSIFGHAVSVHDINGDGRDDISFGTTNQPPQVYINTDEGFDLLNLGLISPPSSIKSMLWVDIDNDGDKDLFISYENSSVRLYENTGDLNLIDITLDSGILMESGVRNYGAAFGDYNNDGFLDLYLCKYYNNMVFEGSEYENKLYENNGDNTFVEVTEAANASVGVHASFMPVWLDYNKDGWQDIFLVNDRLVSQNHLLKNNGDGTFSEVSAEVGTDAVINAMSCSMGDFNNDLLLDLFVANDQFLGNHLYRHNPDHTFTETAETSGVTAFDMCWSGLWMDYDNNGWLDLHVATEQYDVDFTPRNYLFVNNQDDTFSEQGVELGLLGDQHTTYATAQGDWNLDGYPDFVSHCVAPHPSKLWQNTGGSNHFLAVVLEGVISNRDAIGSFIYCYAGNTGQMRYMACGENYLGQDSQRKIFGLGQQTVVDSLVIKWLSGHVDRFYNLSVNQTFQVTEGQSLSNNIEVLGDNYACFGDTILLDAGDWDSYLWSTGDTSRYLGVISEGEYYATTFHSGLPVLSDTAEVFFNVPPNVLHIFQHVQCNGDDSGSIQLINQSGTGVDDVSWTPSGEGTHLTNLSAGTYSYVLLDENGCEVESSISLNEPPPLYVNTSYSNLDPECEDQWFGAVEVAGGTPEYSATWSFFDFESNSELFVLENNMQWCAAGDQSMYVWLNVEDAHECNIQDSLYLPAIESVGLKENEPGILLFPNPAQSHIKVESSEPIQSIGLYDLRGELVMHRAQVNSPSIVLLLDGWSAGIYYCRITHYTGKSQLSRVLIDH